MVSIFFFFINSFYTLQIAPLRGSFYHVLHARKWNYGVSIERRRCKRERSTAWPFLLDVIVFYTLVKYSHRTSRRYCRRSRYMCMCIYVLYKAYSYTRRPRNHALSLSRILNYAELRSEKISKRKRFSEVSAKVNLEHPVYEHIQYRVLVAKKTSSSPTVLT